MKVGGIPSRQNSLRDPISMERKLVGVVHTCHTNNGRKFKIGELWSRTIWAKSKSLSLKNNQHEKGWRCGSSCRVSSLQAQVQTSVMPKKKERKKEILKSCV
jgi:hypothetical protein